MDYEDEFIQKYLNASVASTAIDTIIDSDLSALSINELGIMQSKVSFFMIKLALEKNVRIGNYYRQLNEIHDEWK